MSHMDGSSHTAKACALLLLCTVCSAFGNSLQPISVFAWLQLPSQLLAFEHLVSAAPTSFLLTLSATGLLAAAQTLGCSLAFTALFTALAPSPAYLGVGIAAGVGCVLSLATTAMVIVPHLRLCSHTTHHPGGQPPYLLHRPSPEFRSIVPPLAHPLALVALYCASQTVIATLTNAFIMPANAVLDFAPAVQLAAAGGLTAVNIALALVAAAIHSHWRCGPAPPHASPSLSSTCSSSCGATAKRAFNAPPWWDSDDFCSSSNSSSRGSGGAQEDTPAYSSAAVMAASLAVLLLAAGGFAAYAGSFHASSLETSAPPQMPVACVAAQYARPGNAAYHRLWQRTTERVHAGDGIVLWSEEAVMIESDQEEEQLLAQARDLLVRTAARHAATAKRAADAAAPSSFLKFRLGATPDAAGGALAPAPPRPTYLAITYLHANDTSGMGRGDGTMTNRLVLFSPDGQVAWTYLKAFPVQFGESFVRAGPPIVQTYDSATLGRISGAICYDLDTPSHMLQAGQAGVDIVLQPAWTWGLVGPRHWAGNALRAAESGFTLFRCSSAGISGVVSRRGMVLQQAVTANEGLYLFSLPLQAHMHTLFVAGGHMMERLLLAAAVPLWLMTLLLLPMCSGLLRALGGPSVACSGNFQVAMAV